MATQAHCAFVFETLTTSLEKRKPLSLSDVEDFWKQYTARVSSPGSDGATAADDGNENEDEGDVLDSEMEDGTAGPAGSTLSPSYRPSPAAVTRLMAHTPSTASSSSVQSTVSSLSRASEASSSATSKSSSRSSLFSPSPAGKQATREEEYPLFVTYNVIQEDGEKRLRGCIGTFEPHELEKGLASYALTSAFDDTRFNPITRRELPTLECGVTLLTDFEPISSPLDWTVGTHGLRISFTYHGRRYGSTYLPDVAREQGWTKEETIVSLMRKAGWSGRKDDWRKVGLNVVRYQGRQVKLRFSEWEEWRDWVEEIIR